MVVLVVLGGPLYKSSGRSGRFGLSGRFCRQGSQLTNF